MEPTSRRCCDFEALAQVRLPPSPRLVDLLTDFGQRGGSPSTIGRDSKSSAPSSRVARGSFFFSADIIVIDTVSIITFSIVIALFVAVHSVGFAE